MLETRNNDERTFILALALSYALCEQGRPREFAACVAAVRRDSYAIAANPTVKAHVGEALEFLTKV